MLDMSSKVLKQSSISPFTSSSDLLKFSIEKQNNEICSMPSSWQNSKHFFNDLTPSTCPWWVEENLFFFANLRLPSIIKPMWEGIEPDFRILHVTFYMHDSDYILFILNLNGARLQTYNHNFEANNHFHQTHFFILL